MSRSQLSQDRFEASCSRALSLFYLFFSCIKGLCRKLFGNIEKMYEMNNEKAKARMNLAREKEREDPESRGVCNS